MEKYGKVAFSSSDEVIEYFNNKENSNKELLSVGVIAPRVFDFTFVAFYKYKDK